MSLMPVITLVFTFFRCCFGNSSEVNLEFQNESISRPSLTEIQQRHSATIAWCQPYVYKYRAAAFSGVRSFTGVATGGSRVCCVVACTDDSMVSCGHRFETYAANSTAIFEELYITATFPSPVVDSDLECDDSAVFPVALKTNIMPLEPISYTYEVNNNGPETVYNLNLKEFNDDLYNFAVWGRVFATDGLDADPPVDDNSGVRNIANGLVISFAFFMLLR